jgi:hypothetical protein
LKVLDKFNVKYNNNETFPAGYIREQKVELGLKWGRDKTLKLNRGNGN